MRACERESERECERERDRDRDRDRQTDRNTETETEIEKTETRRESYEKSMQYIIYYLSVFFILLRCRKSNFLCHRGQIHILDSGCWIDFMSFSGIIKTTPKNCVAQTAYLNVTD